MTTILFFVILLASSSYTSATANTSNDKLPSLSLSLSSSNYLRSYDNRILDDKEDNINDGEDDDDDDGDDDEASDAVSVVMGSCLFFSDHQNNTPYNNNSLSSCTKFYGEADVWDYDKMVNYCSHKYNSTFKSNEECPSHNSVSSELENIVGWCHVEKINKGNVTLIEVTPMVAITSITSNNCSDNQRECESVMGGIFKPTSECITTTTTTSSSSSNNSTATTIDDINDEGDSKEQDVIVGYDDGCDESKCVSLGHDFDSFTCYANNNVKYGYAAPMMCADGYQPHIVENEPTIFYNTYYNDTIRHIYYYFTCCPPKLLFDANTSVRHCSNSTTHFDNNNIMICENNDRPYPIQMKNYTTNPWSDEVVQSYSCCDSIINNNGKQTPNFLNITECVPYQNKNYEKMRIWNNLYGRIYPFDCNYLNYQYTNKNGECCKTEQASYHFNQDAAFMMTVYPQIMLSSIAVIACTILIVALLIPLWLHWRVKQAAVNVPVSTTRAANTRLQQAAAASTYSSYNLYLVFLAIPDCVLNLYLLGMYGSYANQQYNPKISGAIIMDSREKALTIMDNDDYDVGENAFEPAFILACSTANLYLNCVVSYEMLVLLRNNNQVITHNPPSLLRVTLQAMSVYLFSIIVFIIHYFIGREVIKADMDDDTNKCWRLAKANLIWSILVTYVCPIGFFIYIWITIKCRNYMPSVTESTKQLVWFFRRIVFVFCLIWLPGMCLVVTGTAFNNGSLIQPGLLFVGLQPIVSTCMAMTKADIRKHTLNVVRLSYISKRLSLTTSYVRMSLSSSLSYIRASRAE